MKAVLYLGGLIIAIATAGCQPNSSTSEFNESPDAISGIIDSEGTGGSPDATVVSQADPDSAGAAESSGTRRDKHGHDDHETSGRGQGMGHAPGGMGRGIGRGFGAMGGMREDMTMLHAMFADRDKITRTVQMLPNGAKATTESDDETIAGLLQEHVPAMEGRVMENKPLPPMTFHPIFVELIKHAEDYTLTYEETDKGMEVTYHAEDPFVIMLVQEHAKLVSRFIKNGTEEIHKPYTLSNPKNEGEANTEAVNAIPESGNEVRDIVESADHPAGA